MQIVGHRGASAVAPENTLAAIRSALETGYGFEVDLQLLRTQEVVVLHDETLWRTATAHSWWSWLGGVVDSGVLRTPVSELSYEEVRAVEVGDAASPSRVPTFAEALSLLRHPPPLKGGDGGGSRLVHCFAEIKAEGAAPGAGFDERLTAASAAAVAESGVLPSQLSWISFSLGACVDIKRRLPQHSAYLVAYVGSAADAWAVARTAHRSKLDGIDLNADPAVVSAELAEWLHARGMRLAVWVWKAPAENDVQEVWGHMDRCGVDYFTSNLPLGLRRWDTARGSPGP